MNGNASLGGKKILITGGAGFIGSWLIEKFINNNEITIFDNGRRDALQFLPSSYKKNIHFIKNDIRNKQAVKRAVKGQDVILHLAAIAGASFYEKDPLLTFSVNFFGSSNILESAINSNIQHIILFSSSEVYGANAHNVSEYDLTPIGTVYEKRWSYGISKLASDHLAFSYYAACQLPITIVRPFNIYGPRQIGEGAIVNMVKEALSTKKIIVTGDGSQKRSWCYITDFVEAILLIVKKKKIGECYNVGNTREYLSIYELAKKVQAHHKTAKIVFAKVKKSEIQDRLPNTTKIKKELQFTARVSLDIGLAETCAWWRSRYK